MNFLKIDGGYGEGGGQIIRSAITLSCITKQPIRIENIRRNRKEVGLKSQHLTAITILQKIADAKVVGAEIGSTELQFIPGDVKSLELVEDVRTAGSIPLILQAIIPIVAISQKKLDLKIKGGTDVLWSPSTNYTQHVLKKAYSKMGIEFSLQLIKPGYYPRGGGEVRLQVYPGNIKSASFSKRKTKNAKLICSFSKIPDKKIRDAVEEIKKKLIDVGFIVDSEIVSQQALDSGASLLIYSIDENSMVGADALFDKNTQRFDLDFDRFIDGVSVDENLADMVIVPASLGDRKTVFQVRKITKHLETNLFVTSKITGCKYGIGKTRDGFEIIVQGVSNPRVK